MAKGEIVKFLASDGIELQGFLADSKGRLGFLHIHGLSGNFYENPFIDHVADLAVRKKIAFLSMNTRGHDYVNDLTKSEGQKHRIVNIGGALERFEDCLIDIKAGTDFLKSSGCERIILQGHSSGCQRIVYYQSQTADSTVIGLILLAPADDMNIAKKLLGADQLTDVKNMIKDGKADTLLQNIAGLPVISAGRLNSLTNPESVEAQLFNYEGEMKAVGSIDIPILVVFGGNDVYLTMTAEASLEILRSKASKSKCGTAVIEGAPHNFRGHEGELIGILDSWLGGFD